MEVYVQTISTGLNKVDSVKKDNGLGIVELKWNTKNVMPPEPSVYPMEKPIDVFDIKSAPTCNKPIVDIVPAPNTATVNWTHEDSVTLQGKRYD